MLAALPSPGDPDFAKLAAALKPYGVGPGGITLEAPSSRMSDVVLSFALLRGEVKLRFTYEGFEVAVPRLNDDHVPMIAKLAEIAHDAIRKRSSDAVGSFRLTYSAHLDLPPGEATTVLAEHLTVAKPGGTLIPDSFAYRATASNRVDVIEKRVLVERSVELPEGLFVEFAGIYQGDSSAALVTERAVQDTIESLKHVGLRSEAEGAL